LRLQRIIPDGGILGPRVQIGKLLLGGIEVKDASSAAQATA
jgi:hypothetical protein